MARLSIDLGASSAPVPRVAAPPAAGGEFGRIIGGIATGEPGATLAPRKLRIALPELPTLPGRPMLIRAPSAETDAILPDARQTLAAPDAEESDPGEAQPETLIPWLAEVAPPPPAPTAIARLAEPLASAEQPAPIAAAVIPAAPPEAGSIASPRMLVSLSAPVPPDAAAPGAQITPPPSALAAPDALPADTVAGRLTDPAARAAPAPAGDSTAVPPQPLPPPAQGAPATPAAEPGIDVGSAAPAAAIGAAAPVAPKAAGARAEPIDAPPPPVAIDQPALPQRPKLAPAVQFQPQPPIDPALATAAATVARTARDDWRPAPVAPEPASGPTGSSMISSAQAPAVASTTAPAPLPVPLPLDTGRVEWIETMIDHIDELAAQGPVRATQIRLMPDALGQVDVAIRKEGGEVHVNFTVETAAARTLIAEAAPRLAELADARGLKLGGTGVETGSGGERRAERPTDETIANPMRPDGEEEGSALPGRDRIA